MYYDQVYYCLDYVMNCIDDSRRCNWLWRVVNGFVDGGILVDNFWFYLLKTVIRINTMSATKMRSRYHVLSDLVFVSLKCHHFSTFFILIYIACEMFWRYYDQFVTHNKQCYLLFHTFSNFHHFENFANIILENGYFH